MPAWLLLDAQGAAEHYQRRAAKLATSGLDSDVYSSRIEKMTTPKPPVSIRMPDDLLEEIKQVAADNERSVSSQIVFMLKAAMVVERKKQTAREMNYASLPRKRKEQDK